MLLTDRPTADINAWIEPTKTHPMVAKKTLAQDIVTAYHGGDAATAAQANWEQQFSRKEDPENIGEVAIPAAETTNGMGLLRLLVAVGFCKSNNEARQKVTEGAVSIGPDRTKLTDPKTMVSVEDGMIVRLGSKKIVRVKLAGNS